jgi:parvulin-like peptidyl-prolyl isomerase
MYSMKLKLIWSSAVSVLLSAVMISAQAATENTAPAMPAMPAMPATPAASTNSTDAMTALFGDPVIVKATGFQIKRSELDQIVTGAKARATASGQQLPPGFNVGILNELIAIQLLLQKATDADRAAGQAEADTQYKKLIQQFGSEDAFKRQLNMVGMTPEQLRNKATQEATAKATLQRELKVSVTDAEVKAYYSNHSADFEEPEMVHVRHILLMTVDPSTRESLPTNTVAAKRKQIDDLLARAKKGEDFATLARQYSEDPGSKDNGGELPEFSRGQMAPEFEAAAFSLATNQISDVVTTVYGFHIIQLLDKKAAHMVDFATVAPDIKEGLIQLKVKKIAPDYIQGLRTAADVKIMDPELQAEEQAVEAEMTNAPAADPSAPAPAQ